MKTEKVTIHNIFDKHIRYIVPIFQRGYVWNREDQWEPLWQDIMDQIKEFVRYRENDNNIHNIRKHFLGSIVLNYYPTTIKHISAYEIIDGQQRLLTIQTLLIAFRDVIKPLNDTFLNSRLQLLTVNAGELFEPSEMFKVWPTNAYHEDLNRIISSGSMEALQVLYPQKKRFGRYFPARPGLIEAYLFFSQAITVYLNNSEDSDVENEKPLTSSEDRIQRATIFYEVLDQYIQLVEIMLEAEDDPQVIFETLNYRGVPLEASDLIRNFLFLNASRQHKDVDALYNQYWKGFDKLDGKYIKFWKEQEKQGRLKRSRLDLFFFHYVTCQTVSDIRITHLYQEFKDYWVNNNIAIEAGLSDIEKSSGYFEKFLIQDTNDELGALSFGLKILDTSTVYPLLLWLCNNKDKLTNKGDFEGILKDIESYLIRRLVCNLTTKNYNRIFLNLLSKINSATNPSRTIVQNELLTLTGESGIWPNDDRFLSSLVYDPLYNTIKARRVNLLLTALEISSRTNKQEKDLVRISLNNTLTVEHVMPQSFKADEWPYSEHEVSELKKLETNQKDLDSRLQELKSRRSILLHSLGNLTLLTQPLNSGVSNGPFREKRPEVTKQSLLILNSYFQRFSDNDTWDEDKILERGKLLAEMAIKVWPFPKV